VFWQSRLNWFSKLSFLLWHSEREEVDGLKVKLAEGGLESGFLDSSATDLGI